MGHHPAPVEAVLAVLAILIVVAALLIVARWRAPDDQELPVFVTDGLCPACGHPVERHHVRRRLSGVLEGCEVPECGCATPLTGLPPVG